LIRAVDFTTYDHPDPRIISWIKANGLDPNNIPEAFPAVIEDRTLTVTEWIVEQSVAGAPPHKTLSDDGSGYKKKRRTVPLLSPPEDHGL
jgi:hypothetical protein